MIFLYCLLLNNLSTFILFRDLFGLTLNLLGPLRILHSNFTLLLWLLSRPCLGRDVFRSSESSTNRTFSLLSSPNLLYSDLFGYRRKISSRLRCTSISPEDRSRRYSRNIKLEEAMTKCSQR